MIFKSLIDFWILVKLLIKLKKKNWFSYLSFLYYVSVFSLFTISFFIRVTLFFNHFYSIFNFYTITSLLFTRIFRDSFILCVLLFVLLFHNVLIFLLFFLRFANFTKVWECWPKVSFYGNNCHWAARQLVRTSTYENRTGIGTIVVTVIITTVILTFSLLNFPTIIDWNKEIRNK